MKKISIIIPVYNVESYIRKSLNSVINQTYPNLEIICIDDGSTDASGRICDEYASRDKRIKVIHKTNSGYPSALNAGLNNTTGDYVGFVDPDDWIELDFYEAAYRAVNNSEVETDIVCTGWFKETVKSSTVIKNKKQVEEIVLNKEQILKYTFERDVYPAFGAYLWNKLFHAKFFNSLEDNGFNLRFCESMMVGCDVLTFTQCALRSRGAIYLDKAYYHYFQRETSLFHSKDLEKRIGSLKAYAKVIELLEHNSIGSENIIWVKRFYVYHASLLAEICIEQRDEENLSLMQSEIKRYLKEYIKTNKEYPERIQRIDSLLKRIETD